MICRTTDISRVRVEIDSLALLMERVATKHHVSNNQTGSSTGSGGGNNVNKSDGNKKSIHESYLISKKEEKNNNDIKNQKSYASQGKYMGSWHLHAADMQEKMNQIEQENLKKHISNSDASVVDGGGVMHSKKADDVGDDDGLSFDANGNIINNNKHGSGGGGVGMNLDDFFDKIESDFMNNKLMSEKSLNNSDEDMRSGAAPLVVAYEDEDDDILV